VSSSSLTQPQISQFNGNNYEYSSFEMKTLFCSQELWDLVENGFTESPDQAAYNVLSQAQKDLIKENKKKDAKALFFIQQAMEESIFPWVAAATRSKHAWDTLQNSYQGTSKVKLVRLQMLRRDFENLKMSNSETINDFFTRANQINSHGDTLDDQKVVENILRSLPIRFDPIVVAIEESKDLSQVYIDSLMGSLQTHEKRLNRSKSSSMENAFKSQVQASSTKRGGRITNRGGRGFGRGRMSNCNEGGRLENSHEEGANSNFFASRRGRGGRHSLEFHGQGQRYDKSHIQCHYC